MKLIIHGGFFSEADQSNETKIAKQTALKEISLKGFQKLKNGAAAVEVVVFCVELLENDSLFNAGYGSQIQSDGKVRMSASLMDGETEKFSGVINIQDIEHPISIAQVLQKEDDRVLGGEGANLYANEKTDLGKFFDPRTDYRIADYEHKKEDLLAKNHQAGKGTVGCVALDIEGKLAAATSTGGKGFELVGRISDSATVAGNYANEHCAVSCTGVGEDIVSNATAAKIVTRVSDGFSLEKAFEKTFLELKKYDGFAGAIAIDASGNIFHHDSHPTMVWASADEGGISCFN